MFVKTLKFLWSLFYLAVVGWCAYRAITSALSDNFPKASYYVGCLALFGIVEALDRIRKISLTVNIDNEVSVSTTLHIPRPPKMEPLTVEEAGK